MSCARCGAALPPGASFCISCGQAVNQAAPTGNNQRPAGGSPPIPSAGAPPPDAALPPDAAPPPGHATAPLSHATAATGPPRQTAAPAPPAAPPPRPLTAPPVHPTQPFGPGPSGPPGWPPPAWSAQPLPEAPVRAMVLAGAALAALAMSLPTVPSWLRHGTGYPQVFALMVLAAACYLAQKPGRFHKAAAGITAGAGALGLFLAEFAARFWASRESLVGPSFAEAWRSLATAVFAAAAALAAAWLAAKLGRDTRRQTTMAMALVAPAFWVANLIAAVIVWLPAAGIAGIFPTGQILGDLIQAVALGAAVKLVAMVCWMPSRRLALGTGAKVWLWICLVATSAQYVAQLVVTEFAQDWQSLPPFQEVLLPLAAVVAYVLLVRSRRVGYLVLLAAAGAMVAAPLATWFAGLAHSTDPVMRLGGLLGILPGVVNPLITGLVLMTAWKKVPPEPPTARRPVPAPLRVGAVTTLVIGLMMALLLLTAYYTEPHGSEGMA
ncbi:MAG: zinc ribbon domain-containing protein, partial [Bifidobacteriaceae bacterium]|nr:zinc ribbon domain-containing protein [Bifidobacteriaceae bacterium]